MSDWKAIDNKLLDHSWYATDEHHAVFKKLRDEDPVHWAQDDHYGRNYWTLTRYEDIKWYLNNHQQLSSRWDARIPRTPRRQTAEERYALGADINYGVNDEPIHGIYRRPLNPHFSAPKISRMKADIESTVDDIIAEMAGKGEGDLVRDFAAELPTRVILRMIGVPEEDWPMLNKATWQWFAPGDPEFTIDGDPAATGLIGKQVVMDYCEALALERRMKPKDDFATIVGTLKIENVELSPHEMRTYLTTLIGGGLETTRNATGVGIGLFLANPEQRKLLLDDPSLVGGAVEEVLRWSSPARTRLRVASEDIEYGGKTIRRGDWVVGFLASANRDERVFEDPEKFDIQRTPNRHLALGDGIHACLGRHVARLELGTALTKVLASFPDLELAAEPEWIQDNVISGYKSMPVRFTPAVALRG